VSGVDLSHVDTWLFDLDDTLYPAESGLGIDISERITDYTQRLTGLPRDAARALQKRYLKDHGLTLRGLMLHHGVDPDVEVVPSPDDYAAGRDPQLETGVRIAIEALAARPAVTPPATSDRPSKRRPPLPPRPTDP